MESQEPIKPQNQEDVNPGSQLDKILNSQQEETLPETNGTGSNKPVPTAGSIIIKGNENEPSEDEESSTDLKS